MAFSRGLYTGWFRGIDNQKLAHGRFGTKRGVFLGEVHPRVGGRQRSRRPLHLTGGPGQTGRRRGVRCRLPESARKAGASIDSGSQASPRRQPVPRAALWRPGDLDFRRIQAGDRIWKTNDPALDRELRADLRGRQDPLFQRPIVAWRSTVAPGRR
jgi:putative protease